MTDFSMLVGEFANGKNLRGMDEIVVQNFMQYNSKFL